MRCPLHRPASAMPASCRFHACPESHCIVRCTHGSISSMHVPHRFPEHVALQLPARERGRAMLLRLLLLLLCTAGDGAVPFSERSALLAIGASWNDSSGTFSTWDGSSDPCDNGWLGVGCSAGMDAVTCVRNDSVVLLAGCLFCVCVCARVFACCEKVCVFISYGTIALAAVL